MTLGEKITLLRNEHNLFHVSIDELVRAYKKGQIFQNLKSKSD